MVIDSRERAALDRYITGNYGADQECSEEADEADVPEPPEPTVNVTISGLTYDAISGGGLLQTEHPEIDTALHEVRRGFGRQYRGTITLDNALRLADHIQGYGELFSGPGLDADDHQTRREGKACLADAARLRKVLADW